VWLDQESASREQAATVELKVADHCQEFLAEVQQGKGALAEFFGECGKGVGALARRSSPTACGSAASVAKSASKSCQSLET